MNYCANCGQQLQAGATYCANCGTATGAPQQQPLTAQQGLAQAGLEVQTFNGLVVVGRLIGLAVGLGIWWFVAGPMFGTDNPLLVIVSFFVLAAVGVFAGQWLTLKLIRG